MFNFRDIKEGLCFFLSIIGSFSLLFFKFFGILENNGYFIRCDLRLFNFMVIGILFCKLLFVVLLFFLELLSYKVMKSF